MIEPFLYQMGVVKHSEEIEDITLGDSKLDEGKYLLNWANATIPLKIKLKEDIQVIEYGKGS